MQRAMLIPEALEKCRIRTCDANKCMWLSPSLCWFNKICSLHIGEFGVSEWVWNDVLFGIKGQTGWQLCILDEPSAFWAYTLEPCAPPVLQGVCEAEQQARVTLFMTLLRLDVFEARRGEPLKLLRSTSVFGLWVWLIASRAVEWNL